MPKSKDQKRKEANARNINHANEYWLKLADSEIKTFRKACALTDNAIASCALGRAVEYLYRYYTTCLEAGHSESEIICGCAGRLCGREKSAIFGAPYRMLEDLFKAFKSNGSNGVAFILSRELASFIRVFYR